MSAVANPFNAKFTGTFGTGEAVFGAPVGEEESVGLLVGLDEGCTYQQGYEIVRCCYCKR